jgi:hypothetical protein
MQNDTNVYVQNKLTPRLNLMLTEHDLPSPTGSAEFITSFSCLAPPYALELDDTSAVQTDRFGTSLTKYYANADAVNVPNDWVDVQGLAKNDLEVTLRDPYMNTSVVGAGVSEVLPSGVGAGVSEVSSSDQCPPGVATYNGMACVVAVVRYKGSLLKGVNITTFSGNGTQLNTSLTETGVTIVQVPIAMNGDTAAFASVRYRDTAKAVHQGVSYDYIDHWASTSTILQR